MFSYLIQAQIFFFDFYEGEQNMVPTAKQLKFDVSKSGTVNAFAFWFDLHLDEEDEISTSPYCAKGRTWQQAVQFVEEVQLNEGATLPVIAKHDTYGITIEIDDAEINRAEIRTGVPLWDPTWKVVHDQTKRSNEALVTACAQNPSEYRKIADLAVQIGARPCDFGVPSQEAAKMCVRMMS